MPGKRSSFTLPVEPISPPPKPASRLGSCAAGFGGGAGYRPRVRRAYFDIVYRHSRTRRRDEYKRNRAIFKGPTGPLRGWATKSLISGQRHAEAGIDGSFQAPPREGAFGSISLARAAPHAASERQPMGSRSRLFRREVASCGETLERERKTARAHSSLLCRPPALIERFHFCGSCPAHQAPLTPLLSPRSPRGCAGFAACL